MREKFEQFAHGCWEATEHKTGLRKALDPNVLNQLPSDTFQPQTTIAPSQL